MTLCAWALLALFWFALPATADAGSVLPAAADSHSVAYVCPPCPHVTNLRESPVHPGPGNCPDCGMALVERPLPLPASAASLPDGAGAFTLLTGPGSAREVVVYYYRPRGLATDARVLIVLSGAGRNAWAYRDHWTEAAERFGVLVLAPHYAEDQYPGFWSYNLARMLRDVVIDPEGRAMTDYRIEDRRPQWLFDDLDRIFEEAVGAMRLQSSGYDVFGHSAGGQFLHRFALFAAADTRAQRLLAANSGWYTVPEDHARFPYGLMDAPLDGAQLATAFARHLVVFLGGADDAHETRGDLVRNPETDRQGLHRLARGRYFHAQAERVAAERQLDFHWKLHVVPGIGHDAKAMSAAAASYLYGDAKSAHATR